MSEDRAHREAELVHVVECPSCGWIRHLLNDSALAEPYTPRVIGRYAVLADALALVDQHRVDRGHEATVEVPR